MTTIKITKCPVDKFFRAFGFYEVDCRVD